MGTIVVVKKGVEIAIASDCCNVRDTAMRNHLNVSHGCILKVGASYIGLNSSVMFQQSLEELIEGLSPAQIPALTSRREVRRFFTDVHETLKHTRGMYVNFQQGQECEWTPMNALVANPHGIFKVDSTRGVYELTKFWAIGTGESYALGAMAGLYDRLDGADEIALAGLDAVKQLEVDMERTTEIFSCNSPKKVISVVHPGGERKQQSDKKVHKIPGIKKPRNRSR